MMVDRSVGEPIGSPLGEPVASSRLEHSGSSDHTPGATLAGTVGNIPTVVTSSAGAALRSPRDGGGRGRPGRVRNATWIIQALTYRDIAIMSSVARLRLITGGQLERLHFGDLAIGGRARVRRRVLARLVSWRVLDTLGRRIGGIRAGSTGLIYTLGPLGHTLTAQDEARRRLWTPGPARLAHTLAISALYVDLVDLSRTSGAAFTVAQFDTEPDCWRPLAPRIMLKPDAYTQLATPHYADHWFLEIDLGTEHLPVITRKLDAYRSYQRHCPDDQAMPRVLITAPTIERYQDITALIRRAHDPDSLFHTAPHPYAAAYLAEQLQQ